MKDTGERLIPKGNKQTLTYGEHMSRYNSIIDIVRNKVVLDVASGSGYGSQLIARYAKSVQGLDNSREAIEYAGKNYPSSNLSYVVGDAQNMPFNDRSFDVIVSFETIEHLPNPSKFINEVKRLLKPDGIFIVSTPNDSEFMDNNEFHLHEFQFPELKSLMEKNFSQQRYYYQGTYFAAGLFNKDIFSRGTDEPISLRSYITFGQPKERSIFYIAVASNSVKSLPEINQNIVLADRWSTKDDIDRDAKKNSYISDLNDDIKTLSAIKHEFDELKKTNAWKFIVFIKKLKKILNKP